MMKIYKKISTTILAILLIVLGTQVLRVSACPVAIGDFVWLDLDRDGIQDIGEPGISGVTVELYKCDGTLLASTVTDVNGLYYFGPSTVPQLHFTNIGDSIVVKVEFVKPIGYYLSPPNVGLNDAVDSDADPSTGMTPCITLTALSWSLTEDLTWDAGLYLPLGEGQSPGYWKRQVKGYVENRGVFHEDIIGLTEEIDDWWELHGDDLPYDCDNYLVPVSALNVRNEDFTIEDAHAIFTNNMYKNLWKPLANWYNWAAGLSPYTDS